MKTTFDSLPALITAIFRWGDGPNAGAPALLGKKHSFPRAYYSSCLRQKKLRHGVGVLGFGIGGLFSF